MQNFYSHGKILLTGEYAVLNGAKALALPCRKGQSLEIGNGVPGKVNWQSLDDNSRTWFQADFKIDDGIFQPLLNQFQGKDPEIKNTAKRLQQILQAAYRANSNKIDNGEGFSVITRLEFNRNWGLGTSSTLINNIANWFEIDAYQLLQNSFGGSGYDLAAAKNQQPVTYQITPKGPVTLAANFNPSYKDNLFFVYLNRKQNSREAIAHYKNQPKEELGDLIDKISGITEQIIKSEYLEEFKMLLEAHETLIAKAVNLPKIKQQLFPDFPGMVKSLGGWGGDFILATGGEKEKEYFQKKGYDTIFDFRDLIL